MEYLYDVTFWLANDEKKKEIDLKEWREHFVMAEGHYNATGKTARNPKRILRTEVESKHIKLRLSSQTPLSTPTLALRSYSQFLVTTDFGAKAAVDNALFRGSWDAVEGEREDINGPEMIKLLAELLMTGKKSDEKLIQKMKEELMDWRDKQ